MRELFEKWCHKNSEDTDMSRFEQEKYRDSVTRTLWRGFEAGYRAARPTFRWDGCNLYIGELDFGHVAPYNERGAWAYCTPEACNSLSRDSKEDAMLAGEEYAAEFIDSLYEGSK